MALEIKHVQNAKFGFYARPGNLKQLLILRRRSVTQRTTEQRVFSVLSAAKLISRIIYVGRNQIKVLGNFLGHRKFDER